MQMAQMQAAMEMGEYGDDYGEDEYYGEEMDEQELAYY
jgi:hypothetical protein